MAAKGGTWEFECPQFVDFAAGLDNSGMDDIYFDCKDQSSPKFDDIFPSLQTPDVKASKCLMKDAEIKLIDKMNAALTVIENTPKLPLTKKKLLSANVNAKSTYRQTAVRAPRNTAFAPSTRIFRSKSIAVVNKILVNKQKKETGLRKRSSSLGDLRTVKTQNKAKGLRKRTSSLNDFRSIKKHTYPTTPMCLKRTMFKAKAKIKSTEEMELEEIAKLQKQLKQHLRFNEISLKKLNLKPRAYINPKGTQIKENLRDIKTGEKGLKPFFERLNMEPKEQRRNLLNFNPDGLKKEAVKINSLFNNHKRVKTLGRVKKENCDAVSQNSSVASSVISDVKESDKNQISMKPQPKKIGFHSGLVFHDNVKKSTMMKPFSFDGKSKENKDQNAACGSKVNVLLPSSVLNLKVDESKENIPRGKARPTFNTKNVKGLHNLKTDIQRPASNKKTLDKRIAFQIRGLPLSENIARN